MISPGTGSDWARLLRSAQAAIRHANSSAPLIEDWTLGGGTALMLRIAHRESRDIDIFLPDPQQLAFLDPATGEPRFGMTPSGYTGDGVRFLKFAFANHGEIDFIVAGALTPTPATPLTIDNENVLVETVAEIIAKKIYHRGSAIKPRDVFDVAASGEKYADSIISGLRAYQERASLALATIERLNPDFLARSISQLAINPAYESIARSARERAKEILRAV